MSLGADSHHVRIFLIETLPEVRQVSCVCALVVVVPAGDWAYVGELSMEIGVLEF